MSKKKDDNAFATTELRSAQERTDIARMEQYVNNSDVLKLAIAEGP